MAKEIHQSIVIDAKIKTTLENMNKTVSQLQEGLNKGITNLDMTKGIGNSLSKTMASFKEEFKHFSDLTKTGNLNFMDSKEAIRSGEKIIEKYREIQRVVGNLNDLQIADAKKLFPSAFNSEINEFQNKLTSLQQNLNNLEVKGLEVTQAETKLNALITQAQELKNKLIDESPLQIAVDDANNKLKSAQEEVEKIRNALKEELKLKLDAADLNVSQLKEQIGKIEGARAARDTSKLAIGERGQVTYEGKTATQWKQSGASKEQVAAAQAAIQAFAAEERQLTSLREALKNADKDAKNLRQAFTGFGEKTDLAKTAEMLGKSAQDIEQTKNALTGQTQAAEQASQAQEKLNQAQEQNKNTSKNIARTTEDIANQEQKVAKLQAQYTQLFGKIDVSKLEQGLQKTLGKDFTPQMLQNKDGIEQLLTKLRETDQADFEKLKASLVQLGVNADTAEDYVRQLREGLLGIKDTSASISKASQDMDMLKNRVLYFFSMTNSVQLFRRAVTKALNTVKELDKTMTEAAVVTEFDVSDMWDKLPQYAKHAQELGVSINGMYQATTLYYQQGLKTNEAMALGIETMKMGKIASMDSTEATKAMTAALRGFNMELNETSATRVNDVYSQLAAVTAADTNQIATAMEKTASIAAAANMEFESTAAFLAQIIETTQEAPETAGTALKTIIARFSEVKSLREQGLASGKDEEGEGIDVNKIQTALKTVGISMEGFFAGTEGLDSILMKLAEKWGTLDFETQRYIATMAAGSRQQSRFIAMMSDYSRTAELVSEAQNSAGASTRQFEKTLESMESKLQRLENAWNEFLMGLANNEILKGAVDLVTSLVTGINTLTNGLSQGAGPLKTIVSLLTTLGALSLGKAALSGGLGWVGRQMGMSPQQTKQQGPTRWQRIDSAVASAQKEGKKGIGAGAKALYYNEDSENIQKVKKAKIAKVQKDVGVQRASLQGAGTAADFKKMLGDQKNTKAAQAAMAKYDEVLRANANSQDKVQLAAKAATEEFERQGGQTDVTAAQSVKLGKTTKLLGVDFRALGGTIMGVGGAISGLAMLFSAFGDNETAEKIGKIAGIFMAVGSIVSVLGPMIQALGTKIAVAGLTAQAAWLPFLIITAVLIGIIALVAIFANKTKTAAEEMAELDSQTKALADAADKAEESMQRLADTQKDLANLQSTMSGLVKGTDEWNKALIESNNKVLELLDTYPELAEYINIDEENGLLKVSAEGWNKIAKKQMEAYAKASTAKLALQTKKTTISRKMIDEDDTLTAEEKTARNKALDIQGQIQIEEFYRQVVAADNGLKGNEFSEYSATVLAASVLAEEGLENFTKQLDDTAKTLEVNEKAYQEYADMMGITLEEAKDTDEATIKNALAAARIQKESASRIKTMNEKIAKLSPEEQKLVKALLSKDGSQITREQAEKMTPKWLDSLGKTLELTGEELSGLTTIITQVSSSFTTLTEKIKIEGLLANLLPKSNYQIFSGIISKIAELQSQGVDPIQINDWFEGLLQGKNEDQQTAILETLAITDWHSIEDLNNTFDTFVEKGLLEPIVAEELESSMKELAGAVSDNTVAQNQQKSFQLKDIMNQILSGELTNIMTTEQKDVLVQSGAFKEEEFQNVGTDEWAFNGDMYSRVVNLYGEIQEKNARGVQGAQKEVIKSNALKEKIEGAVIEGNTTKQFAPTQQFGSVQEAEQWLSSRGLLGEYGSFEEYRVMSGYNWEGITQEYIDIAAKEYLASLHESLAGEYGEEEGAVSIEEIIADLQSGYSYDDATINNIGQQIAHALGENFIEGTNAEKTQWILDKYATYITKAEELKTNLDAELTNAAKGVGAYDGSSAQYGYHGGLVSKDKQDEYAKSYKEGIETRYTYYGGTAFMDQITESRKDLVQNLEGKALEEYNILLKALASDLGYTSKKIKTFTENMTNLSESLNKSKRNTYEYGQALETAYVNIGSLFGESAEWAKGLNISQDLLEGLAAGSEGSFQELEKLLADYAKEGLSKGLEEFSYLAKATLNGKDFDVQANLEMMYSDDPGTREQAKANIIAWLNSLGENAQAAAGQFAFLGQLDGTTVTFQWNEDGTIGNFEVEGYDFSDIAKSYSGGGGGGGGSEYENKYDKLHNALEEINDLLRERERLERRYQNLVNRGVDSYKDIANSQKERVDNLQEEIEKQKYIQEQRGRQIEENIAANPKMEKYIYFETNENGERSIRINWEEINKVKDSKLGEEIDKFYDQNKEWIDSFNEAADAIVEGEDAIYDAMQEGKDEYLDFENQVKEAIEKQRQDEIDKLSEVNDSINDTNSKIIESMQEQINEYRQNRDNQKTEQELSDKQRRLAYLQQDTSGANALEILELQKEIEEGQESYTDQLIDQKISELQKQNDQAAEQRQRQIDIAQSQLDYYIKTGAVWEDVQKFIADGVNPDGTIKPDSKLMELLKGSAEYKGLSEIGKMDWLKGLETTVAQGLAWREGGGVMSTFWSGKEIEFTTADNQILSGIVQEDGTVKVGDQIYEGVTWEGGNVFKTDENRKIDEEKPQEEPSKEPEYKLMEQTYTVWKYGDETYSNQAKAYAAAETRGREIASKEINMALGSGQNLALEDREAIAQRHIAEQRKKVTSYTWTEKKRVPAYKTGGLADFTGPAWLDGTKSKPEYILNADQTKAFFTLVDVLSGLQSSTSKSTEKTGDNTYDIDINVESIGSDYDVEQLAETVKRLINEDARYRNNNAINLMR